MNRPSQPFTVVIGMGRSGIGAARLLRHLGERVLILESQVGADALLARSRSLESEGIAVRLGVPLDLDSFDNLGDTPDRVVVSPGIRWNHPVLEELRQRGIRTEGEMVSVWEATRAIPWVGITGTNGKTTVTHLVHHLLNQGGLKAPQCGNVGTSAAEVALECHRPGGTVPDWLVVELSSYQIEAAPTLAPRVGVWTTLTPDHLERHGTLDAYREIKASLLRKAAVKVLNGDDPDLRSRAAEWPDALWITAGPPRDLPRPMVPSLWIEEGMVSNGEGPLFAADCLSMPGLHNRQNMLLATAVALDAGIGAAMVEAALRSFPGVPHRLERIRDLEGVVYYNDSKATNYDAAEVALHAIDGPLVVLAGGQSKQGDPQGWLSRLRRQAGAVVLFGAAREEFRRLLEAGGVAVPIHACEGLAEAVPAARDLAVSTGSRAVLLSPACASFDQYTDFEARGNHFRSLVLAL